MSIHLVGVEGADTSYRPSNSIWGRAPVAQILAGERDGYVFRQNFQNFRTSANINAAEAAWDQGLKVFGSDGGSIATLDAVRGGITLAADGDNEGVSIGQMVYPFQISRSHLRLWFEVCLKTSTITDTKHGIFCGLIDSSALSATVPIAAAGTLADENFVGFHRLEGDGDYFDTVYKANGVTQVTLQADACPVVADTFTKLGFKYEPTGDRAGNYRLSFYQDGTRLTTSYQMASADGTDFPNDVRLGFVLAILNATASTPGSTSALWAQVAQEFTAG